MEGEVLLPGIPLSALLALGASVLGGMFGLLKWFAARHLADIKGHLDNINERLDAHARDMARLDADFKRLLAELPLHYQRREDAIREYTVINVKLDRLYELILKGQSNE